jgi:hypothetical protein
MSEQQAVRPAQLEEFMRHAASYHRFTLVVKWAMITLASVIGGLTVAFGAGAGPIAGLVVTVVVFYAGIYAMNHGMAHSSELDNGPPPAAG